MHAHETERGVLCGLRRALVGLACLLQEDRGEQTVRQNGRIWQGRRPPHPGPLPLGRGEGESLSVLQQPEASPLPLRGGEGRGEGARYDSIAQDLLRLFHRHSRALPHHAPSLVARRRAGKILVLDL